MATWDGWTIIDGWNVSHSPDGYTLTAQFYAKVNANVPFRGATMPTIGINAVPGAFRAYKVAEVTIAPVSAAGPFVAQVTAKAGLGSSGAGNTGTSLLKTNSLEAGYADYHIRPAWCGLKPAPEGTVAKTIGEWNTGKWSSAAVGDGKDVWTAWSAAVLAGTTIDGSPFTKIVNPRLADKTMRFLQVTVSFYAKETTSGLENWGGFSGVVPVSSMPTWITIPGGDNRWRLFDENITRDTETDGSTRLFKINRVLLGIPNQARDSSGTRLQWNQSEIGQKDWAKI